MSLSRRRLFQRLSPVEASSPAEWIAARGREAGLTEFGEQGMAAGARPIRIASNENPLGPGQHVLDAIVGKFPEAHRYPFNAKQTEGALITAIAQKNAAKNENVLLAPGSGELLVHAVRAFTSASKPLVTAWPSYETPRDIAKKMGIPVREAALDGKLRIDIAKMVEASKGAGLVFFCNPNNPTATVHGKSAAVDLVKAIRAASPETVILIDEAYHDYVTDPAYGSMIDVALATPNVFVTRTFSKAYGMAGLRAGYAIGHAPTVKSIAAYKMPYGLGTLTLGGAIVGFANDAHIASERKRNTEVRNFTVKAFADMGVTATDSQTNFLFLDIKRPAAGFRDACRAQGVLVGRDFPPYEKTHVRVSLGTMDEMKKAVEVFKKVLGSTTTTSSKDKQQ
ncbi:MAG: aminotransferase class I/II-fold pyridoxal phosphate-dependent enzyme [Acidobacteria bacterium]|nr:aminotransferase class I/II-fold pyridoxal phosphate-dependent enzyme [Acidobacteriota bacterium]